MKVTLDCIYDNLIYKLTLIEYDNRYWWSTPFYSPFHPHPNPILAVKFKDSLRSVSIHNDSLSIIFAFIEDDLLSLGQPLHSSINECEDGRCVIITSELL